MKPRARAWARSYRYFVHLDVEKFVPAIDHAVVGEQIARDNPEAWVRAMCRDLFVPIARSVGLPLGTLTSQLWANRYLDPVDHLAKDRLKVRPYLRYMDDMLVFGDQQGRTTARLDE